VNPTDDVRRGAAVRGRRDMSGNDIYATPRIVTDLSECYFYHTMDIPGYGYVEGEWDLRKGVRQYLGAVDFKGKRVLEIGTASGFLCFYMESQGAEVVAYDLSENQEWDIVPFSGYDYRQFMLSRKAHIRRINNSFWLCHRAYRSHARVVYGEVYDIPEEIGMVDISTFGCILLHVRDPFHALQNALRLTKETVIITEPLRRWYFPVQLLSKFVGPPLVFLPEFRSCKPKETWWVLSPEVIKRFIGALGFEEAQVRYHFQKFQGRKRLLYSVIGQRTIDPHSM
jgi:SAM-dependent methyltransferase